MSSLCFVNNKLYQKFSKLEKNHDGNIFLRHSKNQYLSRPPVPPVLSKEKGNQSLPTFRIVLKLSQVPSVEKEKGEKGHFLLLLKSVCFKVKMFLLFLHACVNILTCGGPQPCWRGPLR